MYCIQCGAQNNDGAKFCSKCGQPLDKVPKPESSGTINQQGTPRSKRYLIPIIAVVAVAIVAIYFVIAKNQGANPQSNTARNESETIDYTENNNYTENTEVSSNTSAEDVSLDTIVAQCPDCRPAIETYLTLISSFSSLNTTEDNINALVMQLSQQMNHFCTAPAIYVENHPYAFNGSTGFYTGDWIGAGPAGKGTYNGAIYGKRTVAYEGDWGFGVPNGEGQLYIQDYMDAWDLTYTGEFKNGMRDGEGIWFETYDSPYHPHLFRVYDKAIYSNNQLTDWVNCTEYNEETQEIQKYYKMSTDERGYPIAGAIWGANEPSPEVKAMQDKAMTALMIGVAAYVTGRMVKEAINSFTQDIEDNPFYDPNANPNSPEALLQAREKQDAEKAAQRERAKEKIKNDARYELGLYDKGIKPRDYNFEYFESIYYSN